MSEELLERGADLQAARSVLGSAAGGSGRLLVVEAAAGLGKSALLSAVRASASGLRVLSAVGSELERDFSFGVALQLLEAEAARARTPTAGAAALAAPVFDRSGDAFDDFAIFHGLHWLVADLAAEQPLLLCVDDAHWADPLSLRFLLYLAQRLDELPVAVVIALRPDEPGDQARVLRRLGAHRLAVPVRLAPLSAGSVAVMVRERLGASATDEVCAACAHATGGNPFYLRSLLDAGIEGDAVGTVEAAQTVRRRLSALGPAAVALAESVAVLGPGTPLHQAAALADADPDDAAVAADELVRAGVFAVAADGSAPRRVVAPGAAGDALDADASGRGGPAPPALAFAHPLLQEAVSAEIGAARRSRAHARAARLLAEAGADAERVASHLVAAGGADDAWSVDALRSAARRARSRGAPQVAARHLGAALAGPVAAGERPALVLECAHAEAKAGVPDAAARVGEALDLLDDHGERAEAALRLGLALADGGKHREAADVFGRGLERNGVDPELQMTLRASRAAIGGLDAAHEMPGGLDAILERTASGRATAPERLMLSHGALAAGIVGTSVEETARLARGALAGASPDAASAMDVSALVLAATALITATELGEAVEALTEAIERARARGSVLAYSSASHARAHAFLRQGRLADAIADAQSVIDASRYGWEPALPAAHAALVTASLERGELDAAEEALEIAGGAERWEPSFTWNDYLEARGHLKLERGDAEGALADASECGARLLALNAAHPSVVPWRSVAASAAAALGDVEQAARLADDDLAAARRFGSAWALGRALRTAGPLAGGDRGIELLREAVDVLDGTGAALELAHAQASLGDLLLDGGHRLAAREPLRAALDLAHRCGATPLEERARAALVTAGARPRRAASSGRDALTPREARIARMAADGRSNREIAEALFITMKTVETHLGHAYAKLGVTSRTDLPAALDL